MAWTSVRSCDLTVVVEFLFIKMNIQMILMYGGISQKQFHLKGNENRYMFKCEFEI